MDDKSTVHQLARRLQRLAARPDVKLVGSSTSVGSDEDTTARHLPVPFGTEGQVLTLIDTAGDIEASWEDAGSGPGGSLSVEEGSVEVSAAVDTLDFDADHFVVVEDVAGHVQIALEAEYYFDALSAALTSDDGSVDIVPDGGTNTVDLSVEVPDDIVSTDSSVDISGGGGADWDLSVVDYVQDVLDDALADEGSQTWVNNHGYGAIVKTPTGVSVVQYGMATGSSAGTTANADDTDGAWLQVTQTTTASFSGRSDMQIGYYADWGLTWVSRVKLYSSITSQRFWSGMFSSILATATDNDLPASTSMAAFRHSTNASDTNFKCITSDGSGNYTTTDSGVAAAANTAYIFRIHFGTTTARFYIDDVLVATHSTRLPASATSLGWLVGVKNLVGGGSARGLKYGYLSLSRRK